MTLFLPPVFLSLNMLSIAARPARYAASKSASSAGVATGAGLIGVILEKPSYEEELTRADL